MSETMELMVIPAANLPVILAADDKDIIGKLKKELAGWKADATTVQGRVEIATKKGKVSTAKQDLLRIAKGLKADHQATLKGIIAEEKIIEERFDALRDDVGRELDEYRTREKAKEGARVQAHTDALVSITESEGYGLTETASELQARLDWLRAFPFRDWEEFRDRAETEMRNELARTERLLDAAVNREAEAVELVRLREAEAKRQAEADALALIAREEQIARDAAERAAREVQQRADREAREVEERNQTALREAALAQERQRAEALRKEREAAEALALAECNRLAAEDREQAAAQMAEAARVAAERKAETERLAAIEAERARAARIVAEQKAEDDRRAADTAHRGAINREIVADLLAIFSETVVPDKTHGPRLSETQARAVVTALAKRQIRHARIVY